MLHYITLHYITLHYTTLHSHGMTYSNQISHGDQSRWEENFYRVDPAPGPGQIFMTRMLTSDLFVVANLLVD